MTIFAVMCAGIYPAVHVGRVWFAWYLAPIPNANGIWPNFRSPLLWDVFAVSTYLSVSIMFWYVGLIPDAAAMRDRVKNKIGKYFYAIFCLGWRGSARQWANYEMCYLMLAGIATLLVITTCTVVSSDFSTSVIPGWHGTIFIPYFGVGAIYGGFCMLITLLVPIRQYYKLSELVTLRHIDICCRFVLLMALLITYIYGDGILHRLHRRQPERIPHLLLRPHPRPLLADVVRHDLLQLHHRAAFLDEEGPAQPVAGLHHRPLPQRRHVAGALRHHRRLHHARLPALLLGHVLPHLGRRPHLRRHLRRVLPDVPALHPLPAGHRHLRSPRRACPRPTRTRRPSSSPTTLPSRSTCPHPPMPRRRRPMPENSALIHPVEAGTLPGEALRRRRRIRRPGGALPCRGKGPRPGLQVVGLLHALLHPRPRPRHGPAQVVRPLLHPHGRPGRPRRRVPARRHHLGLRLSDRHPGQALLQPCPPSCPSSTCS